ncbi:MAG: hypothetical protein C0506_08045 [Anaerolinea sp.]|nr:hypothetical protein [Anaerolinea sp.]
MTTVNQTAALLVAFALAIGALSGGPLRGPRAAAAADPVVVEVTSSADTAASPACPDATRCTLRRAIEVANTDASGLPVRITFAETAFPAAATATIVVGSTPLPVVTREDVTIDGSGRGVRLAGTTQSVTPTVNGLVTSGTRATVRGLEIRGFAGTCLHMSGPSSTAGGDPAAGQGNVIDDCDVGVRVDGADSLVHGNSIGLSPGVAGANSVSTGIWATGADTIVGEAASGEGHANAIGNAASGIRIGGVNVAALTGVRVAGNSIGGEVDAPAPVQAGIDVFAPAAGVLITENGVRTAASGIRVHGSAAGPSAVKVTISRNTFANIAGLAIDLNADGLANPNDEGDTDDGANGLRNSPVLIRAVQSSVTGKACAGCQVQLYFAHHLPGGKSDYGTEPLPGAVATAGPDGSFAFDNPPVAPGQWLVALATDGEGNTSEFSTSTRVGAGNVQCGIPSLSPGWNLVGYFGAQAVNLGAAFPADGPGVGSVRAIYRLNAGTGSYAGWLSDTAAGRTLNALQPGEAYWMLAEAAVALPGGFSLSVPVPVQLRAGWNTVVYIGATAAVEDALASIAGKYTGLYAWSAASQAWQRYGGPGVPAWARDFSELQACGAFEIFMTQDAVLTPLQP